MSRHHFRYLILTIFFISELFWSRKAAAQDQIDPRPLIGILLPLSGDHAQLGRRAQAMINLAWLEHQSVRLLFYDTQETTPEDAFERAIEDDSIALFGPIGDIESEAIAIQAENEQIPLFTLSGSPLIERDREWVFRLRTTPFEQANALGAVTESLSNAETIAIFAPDDRYGDLAVLGFVLGVQNTTSRVVRIVRYESEEPDVSDGIQELIGRRVHRLELPSDPWNSPPRSSIRRRRGDRSRPDSIFIPDYASQIANILPFLEFQGWIDQAIHDDIQLLGLSGWAGYELTFVGGLAAGAIITQVFHHTDANAHIEQFVQVLGDIPLQWDAQVFDAAGFVFSTIAELPRNERSPTDLIRIMDRLPAYNGLCGQMWLDAQGAVLRDIRLWEVDGAGFFFPVTTIHPQHAF